MARLKHWGVPPPLRPGAALHTKLMELGDRIPTASSLLRPHRRRVLSFCGQHGGLTRRPGEIEGPAETE